MSDKSIESDDQWEVESDNDETSFNMDELLEDVREQVIEYMKKEGPKIIQQEVKRQVTALIRSEIGSLKRQGASLDLNMLDSSLSPKRESESKSSKSNEKRSSSEKSNKNVKKCLFVYKFKARIQLLADTGKVVL